MNRRKLLLRAAPLILCAADQTITWETIGLASLPKDIQSQVVTFIDRQMCHIEEHELC
ncbi:MAG: hypothetical protein JSU70_16210 [Phycisphaerales bacterium]|nr:MAG: hypothetical protein JSU70_16210 [Phycisphaerales bacterium]